MTPLARTATSATRAMIAQAVCDEQEQRKADHLPEMAAHQQAARAE